MKDALPGMEIITLPTPFPVGPVNLYLIKEEPITLIDTGPNIPQAAELLRSALEGHGVAVQDLKRIIITHNHPDHIGLAGLLQRESGAEVYLQESELASLTDNPDSEADYAGLLVHAGIPQVEIEAISRWSKANRKVNANGLEFSKVIALKGDEAFDYLSGTWQSILTPGHSPGHICLYHSASQSLISGDHILADISPNPLLKYNSQRTARNKSLVEYLATLQQVLELPLAKIYPGHGQPFSDYQVVLERFYYHFHQREAAVYQLVTKTGKTAYQIAAEMYPKMQGIDIYLAVSRVFGHMDILVDAGKVIEQEVAGISYFRLL